MTTRDLNIWTELEALEDGFKPAIRRRWNFSVNGGNVTVELEHAHPSIPGVYSAIAVYCEQLYFCCHRWVRIGVDVI